MSKVKKSDLKWRGCYILYPEAHTFKLLWSCYMGNKTYHGVRLIFVSHLRREIKQDIQSWGLPKEVKCTYTVVYKEVSYAWLRHWLPSRWVFYWAGMTLKRSFIENPLRRRKKILSGRIRKLWLSRENHIGVGSTPARSGDYIYIL